MDIRNATPRVLPSMSAARGLVARLTADEEDGWTYRAVSAGVGALVAAYDETGAFVGYL